MLLFESLAYSTVQDLGILEAGIQLAIRNVTGPGVASRVSFLPYATTSTEALVIPFDESHVRTIMAKKTFIIDKAYAYYVAAAPTSTGTPAAATTRHATTQRSDAEQDDTKSSVTTFGVVLAVIVCVALCLLCAICCCWRRRDSMELDGNAGPEMMDNPMYVAKDMEDGGVADRSGAGGFMPLSQDRSFDWNGMDAEDVNAAALGADPHFSQTGASGHAAAGEGSFFGHQDGHRGDTSRSFAGGAKSHPDGLEAPPRRDGFPGSAAANSSASMMFPDRVAPGAVGEPHGWDESNVLQMANVPNLMDARREMNATLADAFDLLLAPMYEDVVNEGGYQPNDFAGFPRYDAELDEPPSFDAPSSTTANVFFTPSL